MSFNIEYFGTSHGPEVGLTVSGLPSGEEFSLLELTDFLNRRRPGTSDLSSPRLEKDIPIFESGISKTSDDKMTTTGETLKVSLKNEDVNSSHYEELKNTPRPGHADYTAYAKYGNFEVGGGQFSGRLTAPTCVLGSICLQMLKRRSISISAAIDKVGDIEDAKKNGDSVGGIIKCQIDGLPAGVGGPFTNGLESRLSSALFGIPAVKGVEFGAGFAAAFMKGSENNDEFTVENGKVITKTNNCGGILGGISTGMPIVFRVAFKPTPSISLPQKTVNLSTMEETTISINGRHDPCVVPRCVPVVEAVAAITITEVLKEENKL